MALCVVVVMGCAGANTGTTVSDTEPLSTTEPTTTASETVLTSVPLLTSEPVPSKSSGTGASHWLSADQRRRADQLISTFENSSTTIRYDYAENLGDGRGVTAGRAGFTTATCDALDVVRIYVAEVDDTPLTAFIPELEHLCDDTSDDTEQLPEAAFMQAWRTAANDARFRAAQDKIVDREYYVPAMEAADRLGLRSALARAELYDTAIQHGAGDDPDGLAAIIARTRSAVGDPDRIGERAWLDAFFDQRIATLRNPANTETAQAWRESTDRVECMRRVADDDNLDLEGPVRTNVYGDEFTID